MNNLHIKKVGWGPHKEAIKKANKPFYDMLARSLLVEKADFYFYLIEYKFGMNILEHGKLQIPVGKSKQVSLDDPCVPQTVQEDLSYSSIPFGVILKNGSEAYTEIEGRPITLSFFNTGSYLGLWEMFDPKMSHFPKTIWNMVAGARNMFMLANIGEIESHKRIKKHFLVSRSAPKKIADHWAVFREIAQYPRFEEKWSCTIAVFPKKWIDSTSDEVKQLRYFLLEKAWQFSEYWRNLTTRDVVWELFTNYLTKNQLKPNPQFLDNLKHLLAISLGAIPGYVPASKSSHSGPIAGLMKVYKEVYRLKYDPVIMIPHHVNINCYDGSVYYIPQNPLFILSLPKYKNIISNLGDLRSLKELVECFISAAMQGDLRLEGTPWQEILDNIRFDFFHDKYDDYEEILQANALFAKDKRFSKFNNIAKSNPLTRSGCVRISKIYDA